MRLGSRAAAMVIDDGDPSTAKGKGTSGAHEFLRHEKCVAEKAVPHHGKVISPALVWPLQVCGFGMRNSLFPSTAVLSADQQVRHALTQRLRQTSVPSTSEEDVRGLS
jgi:hypothetical protein